MKLKYSLAAAAAGVLLAACLICESRYDLEVTRYTLSFGSLPPEFDDFRILQLSDLHGMSFGKGNSRLIEAVKSLKPDLIALTGDMAGDERDYAAVLSLLDGIEGLAPIYYVNGNHEWAGGCVQDVQKLMELYHVRCLRNAYDTISRDGAQIVICGAEDPNGRADMPKPSLLAAALRSEYPEEFVLWLAHRNDYVTKYPALPVELVLCGHAHGGIVRLPGIGGLLNTDRSLGADFETGLYYGDRFTMCVSRGLGNSILVPRLFNRPEIVCVDLKSGA